jgi:hypothetical protein
VYNPTGTDGNFYIYRGEGSGFFSDQTSWTWGAFPTGKVFSGDFNGDGKWDVGLYNPNATDGNFFIQYGNGAGGFSSQTAWHWGVFPQGQVFTGDFNKDGKWDVAFRSGTKTYTSLSKGEVRLVCKVLRLSGVGLELADERYDPAAVWTPARFNHTFEDPHD